MAIAVHRTFRRTDDLRRTRVRFLHVLAEDGPHAREQTLCRAPMVDTRGSYATFLDPMPLTPPNGLAWCPLCIGSLAARLGVLASIAARLAPMAPRAVPGGEA